MIWSWQPWVGMKWWLWLLCVEWPMVTLLLWIVRHLFDDDSEEDDDPDEDEKTADYCE